MEKLRKRCRQTIVGFALHKSLTLILGNGVATEGSQVYGEASRVSAGGFNRKNERTLSR